MAAVRTIPFADWAAFRRDFFVEFYAGGRFERGRYLFRGSRDADWALVSTFDRQFAAVPLGERMQLWKELTEQWRQGCRDVGVPEQVTADDAALWALGRHHGLPTRMLDWSLSPYVATFFAFRSHLLARPDGHEQVAIWVLHLDHPVWSRAGVEIVTVPVQANDRLRNQGGRFTLCRAEMTGLEEYVERMAGGAGTALTRCLLPAWEAAAAMADLDAMGVTDHELFPDLDGLAGLAVVRAALAVTHRASGR
jgi:hypothetical protein